MALGLEAWFREEHHSKWKTSALESATLILVPLVPSICCTIQLEPLRQNSTDGAASTTEIHVSEFWKLGIQDRGPAASVPGESSTWPADNAFLLGPCVEERGIQQGL